MGLLNKTKTYLVGPMENLDGRGWREYIESEFEKMGIVCFNPYHKPYLRSIEEGPSVRQQIDESIANGDFDFAAKVFKEIRAFDLGLVDRSDFIVAHIHPKIASYGSAEEIVTAIKIKRPVFLSIEGGKAQCPRWLLGALPHKFIYDSPEDIVKMIQKIDSGEVEANSDRWRLLKECYR